VRVGRGGVVGANSVVTEDVAPLTVVAGSPARPLRTLTAPPGWS
jgi:acetyltransferase-like isoleucine patch superfamily enzyme